MKHEIFSLFKFTAIQLPTDINRKNFQPQHYLGISFSSKET